MQKEIFEQPQAIRDTLESRITKESVVTSAFGHKARDVFKNIKRVQIVACWHKLQRWSSSKILA